MSTKNIDTVIMGGTFNPVHIGHLHLSEEIRKMFQPERIIIVPSNISAHKKDMDVLSAVHRLEMLKLATEKTDIIVEECELERLGVSYTIDTVKYIRDKYKLKTKPGLVIGDDLAEG
ncbi:MAG: nicotinate-nicotinamide nucleotide adenylyltransferase, partial [Spirochaetales bacterium]|nr:nicotinate-nicotinamide nucleotide adenylyltransferase [Spirochaetales bacterium]